MADHKDSHSQSAPGAGPNHPGGQYSGTSGHGGSVKEKLSGGGRHGGDDKK